MSLSGFRDSQQEIPTLHTPLLGTATYRSQISILVDMTDCRIFHLNKQAHKFVLIDLPDGGKIQNETMGPVKVSLLD